MALETKVCCSDFDGSRSPSELMNLCILISLADEMILPKLKTSLLKAENKGVSSYYKDHPLSFRFSPAEWKVLPRRPNSLLMCLSRADLLHEILLNILHKIFSIDLIVFYFVVIHEQSSLKVD